MNEHDLTAYILAGGGSRRMGVDKLFLEIDGLSLLQRAIIVCDAAFNTVKLVAGNAAKFSSLDFPVILDSPKACGPMAGVIAALEDCDTDHCFITAVDLVDLRNEIVISLVSQYKNQQYLGLLEDGGVQPLCGIYHKSALDILYRFAQKDDFRMTEAVQEMNHYGIELPAGLWRNLNRPEDLTTGDFDA